MKLHSPELLRHLISETILIMVPDSEHFGGYSADKVDRNRIELRRLIKPMLDDSQKFIFDTGFDRDEETTEAVKATALEMREFGKFHLPHRVTVLEDPYTEDDDCTKNIYVIEEHEDRIETFLVRRNGLRDRTRLNTPTYSVFPTTVSFHHRKRDEKVYIASRVKLSDVYRTELSNAVYAVLKFVVLLAAEGIMKERIAVHKMHGTSGLPYRKYPYTIIRIPFVDNQDAGCWQGTRPRRHLVRGYMWGRNTRPREQQKWISAYFRGDKELGTVDRDGYLLKD